MIERKHLSEVDNLIPVLECYIIYQGKVLLFKRSPSAKRFPNYWTGPGGHVDHDEDFLKAAIREVKEEVGISILANQISLRVVAIHHHLDRNETYLILIYRVEIENLQNLEESEEGFGQWFELSKALTMDNVFPPAKFYFEHVFRKDSGIMYTNLEMENAQVTRTLGQRTDVDT